MLANRQQLLRVTAIKMNNLVKLLNYVTKEKKATQNNAEIITQSTAVKVDG